MCHSLLRGEAEDSMAGKAQAQKPRAQPNASRIATCGPLSQIVSLLFKDSAFASLRPKIEQAVAARSAAAATRAGDDGEQSPERTEPVFPEEGGGRRGAEAARSRAGEECSTSRPGVPFVVHVCAEKLLSQARSTP